MLGDGQSFSGAELLRATRSPTPACWGPRCAGGSGSATPTTRIFHLYVGGPRARSWSRAFAHPGNFPVPGAKKGSPFPRGPLQGGESGEASEPPHFLGRGGIGSYEPLAAGVGDGVAEPRVAQELRVGLGEVVAAVGLQGAHGFPGFSPWAPRG